MSLVASEIAEKLLQIKAIKLSPQKPFIWASGKESPIYCDNRISLSYPKVRSYIIKSFVETIKDQFSQTEAIIGVATAGIPHGALIADALELPFAYVRSKAKAHGRQNLIEGEIKAASKVLLIEDLISTGGSSMKAVHALREAGHEVLGVLAIFEYGFKQAAMLFEKEQCEYQTLSNYDTLIEEAVKLNYVSEEELLFLQNWKSSS